MVKKIGCMLLIAFFMHKESALKGMEGQPAEIAEMGIIAPLDTPLPSHYSLSASYSVSFLENTLQEEMEEAVRQLCLERYHSGEELAKKMLWFNSRLNLPVAMIFVNYGADLNYALQQILVNGDLKLEDQRTWVLFCLTRGAQIPSGYEEVIRKIIGQRTNSLLSAMLNEGDYTVLPEEIQELFLLAAGQGKFKLLLKILTTHRNLIQPETMEEAFINTAYAGHESILRLLFKYNKNKDEMKNDAWSKTFQYALFCAVLRKNASIINLIIERCRQCIYTVDLAKVLKQIKVILKLEGLPKDLKAHYLEIFAALEKANAHSSRGDSFEPIVLSTSLPEPSTIILRSSQIDSSGGRRITEISVEPYEQETPVPAQNEVLTPRARQRAISLPMRRKKGRVSTNLLRSIFTKKHNAEEKK